MSQRFTPQTANFDLTTTAKTVLTLVPDSTRARHIQIGLQLGGALVTTAEKNLDGTGGAFEVEVLIDGIPWNGSVEATLAAGTTQVILFTGEFNVQAGQEVTVTVLSPNAADDDVDVQAVAYAVDSVNVEAINNITDAAVRISQSLGTMKVGTVDDTAFTPTQTQFEANDITAPLTSHLMGRRLLFLTGTLTLQATYIQASSLVGGRLFYTVSQLSASPADGDTFLVV
jgi:hypothetical protein